MNIVNYRYVPPALREGARNLRLDREAQEQINRLNVRLQEELRRSGESFVSRTTLRFSRYGAEVPIVALRCVLANPLTEERHLRAALDEQVGLGARLLGEEG